MQKSHWVPYSFGLVPHRSKELRKLHPLECKSLIGCPIHSALCRIEAESFVIRITSIHWNAKVSLGALFIRPCAASKQRASLITSAGMQKSHWVPHSFDLVPHRSKELRKLHPLECKSLIGCPIHSALCRIEAKSFVNYIHWNAKVSLGALFIRPCAASKQRAS